MVFVGLCQEGNLKSLLCLYSTGYRKSFKGHTQQKLWNTGLSSNENSILTNESFLPKISADTHPIHFMILLLFKPSKVFTHNTLRRSRLFNHRGCQNQLLTTLLPQRLLPERERDLTGRGGWGEEIAVLDDDRWREGRQTPFPIPLILPLLAHPVWTSIPFWNLEGLAGKREESTEV